MTAHISKAPIAQRSAIGFFTFSPYIYFFLFKYFTANELIVMIPVEIAFSSKIMPGLCKPLCEASVHSVDVLKIE
mgnify:CR=1 FL=1